MDLDQDACYWALRAKDVRFDGRFFVAVKTTEIYCRRPSESGGDDWILDAHDGDCDAD